jgi:hypothetical protein
MASAREEAKRTSPARVAREDKATTWGGTRRRLPVGTVTGAAMVILRRHAAWSVWGAWRAVKEFGRGP